MQSFLSKGATMCHVTQRFINCHYQVNLSDVGKTMDHATLDAIAQTKVFIHYGTACLIGFLAWLYFKLD